MTRSGNFIDVAGNVGRAIKAFRRGDPVLIQGLSDREDGTNLVYPAAAVTPADIERLRRDSGGSIGVALPNSVVTAFDDSFRTKASTFSGDGAERRAYDGRPSPSVTIRSRDTRTEVTDQDLAATITALAAAAENPQTFDFEATFHVPGCVNLLRAAPGLLAERQGPRELGIALAEAGEHPPAAVVCEMLDDDTGDGLSEQDVRPYAQETGIVYVDARDLIMVLR